MELRAYSPFSFDPFDGFNRVFPDLQMLKPSRNPVDAQETETAYEIDVDAPGLKKEDIKIELLENRLTISGERRKAGFGKFSREVVFGTDIDGDKIEARYEDGVLHLTVPKVEAKKPQLIAVK